MNFQITPLVRIDSARRMQFSFVCALLNRIDIAPNCYNILGIGNHFRFNCWMEEQIFMIGISLIDTPLDHGQSSIC